MALGTHAVRLFGLLFVFVASIAILATWSSDSLPDFDDGLAAIKDSIGSLAHSNSSVFKNAIQLDPLPEQPPFGAVVAAAQNTTDLSWMLFFQQNWTTYPYDVDKPDNPDPRLRLPMSKGHEAMVYLSFIIDNYDELPWSTMFVHGHMEAWHQEDIIIRLLKDLNLNALAREGYISLRCDWYPSCPKEIRPVDRDAVIWGPGVHRKQLEDAIAGNWRQIFPDEKLPRTISSQCCAQFGVTRQAILRRPKTDYERMRQWLIDTLMIDDMSGRVFEKLWAYIFTGESVHCPSPDRCACKYFGRCEPQEWTKAPEGIEFPQWP